MADQKLIEVVVRNVTNGPKVLNAQPSGLLAAGDSTDVPVKMTEAEYEVAKGTGWFEFDGDASPTTEPGPLDGSVEELTAHLATVSDPDEVQKLIDAETAGKSRKSAMAALEARRDELLGA